MEDLTGGEGFRVIVTESGLLIEEGAPEVITLIYPGMGEYSVRFAEFCGRCDYQHNYDRIQEFVAALGSNSHFGDLALELCTDAPYDWHTPTALVHIAETLLDGLKMSGKVLNAQPMEHLENSTFDRDVRFVAKRVENALALLGATALGAAQLVVGHLYGVFNDMGARPAADSYDCVLQDNLRCSVAALLRDCDDVKLAFAGLNARNQDIEWPEDLRDPLESLCGCLQASPRATLRTLLEPSADRVQKSIFDTLNCPVGGARVAEVFASYSLQQLLDIQADRSLMPALNEVKRIYHLAVSRGGEHTSPQLLAMRKAARSGLKTLGNVATGLCGWLAQYRLRLDDVLPERLRCLDLINRGTDVLRMLDDSEDLINVEEYWNAVRAANTTLQSAVNAQATNYLLLVENMKQKHAALQQVLNQPQEQEQESPAPLALPAASVAHWGASPGARARAAAPGVSALAQGFGAMDVTHSWGGLPRVPFGGDAFGCTADSAAGAAPDP